MNSQDRLESEIVMLKSKNEWLSSRVMQLAQTLEWAREQYWNRCYDGSGNVRALTLDEFNKRLDELLK